MYLRIYQNLLVDFYRFGCLMSTCILRLQRYCIYTQLFCQYLKIVIDDKMFIMLIMIFYLSISYIQRNVENSNCHLLNTLNAKFSKMWVLLLKYALVLWKTYWNPTTLGQEESKSSISVSYQIVCKENFLLTQHLIYFLQEGSFHLYISLIEKYVPQ